MSDELNNSNINRVNQISSDSPFSSIHEEPIVGGWNSISGNNFNIVNSEGEDNEEGEADVQNVDPT